MKFQISALAISSIILVGCASSSQNLERVDPFEKINRSMYNFNCHVLDPYVVRPIALVWRDHVPNPVRIGLSNFTKNLEEPAVMVNYFLQGDPYMGMVHFTRFFLNTLLGGGCVDVAGMANLKLQGEHPHRFGSTLSYYRIGCGPYLHLPFYGSFTIRNDLGNMVDMFYPVLSWLTWPISLSKWIIEGVEMRAQLLDLGGFLHHSSDPYILVREVYFQNHDFITNSRKLRLENNPNTRMIKEELLEIDVE